MKWRREPVDGQARDELAEERRAAKEVLHEAADLVLEIQVAAERMRDILAELAEEEANGLTETTPDKAGGGPGGRGPAEGRGQAPG